MYHNFVEADAIHLQSLPSYFSLTKLIAIEILSHLAKLDNKFLIKADILYILAGKPSHLY